MAEMAKQQAVNLWVEGQSSFQCSFGQPKNPMEIINMAEKSNEERNKFDINDVPEDHSSMNFQFSFDQSKNNLEIIDNAEKSNEERNKFHIDTGNTSNEVETVPKGDYLYFIPTYMILYSN